MKIQSFFLPIVFVLVSGLTLPAQTNSTPTSRKSNSGNGGDLFEVNLFGGGNFVNRQNIAPHQDLSNGGVVGFRITENFWNYISLEQTGMVHGVANAVYRIPGTERDYSFGSRLRQFHFNPIFHFKPRESRVRPFVTAGFGMDYFGVTEGARRQSVQEESKPIVELEPLAGRHQDRDDDQAEREPVPAHLVRNVASALAHAPHSPANEPCRSRPDALQGAHRPRGGLLLRARRLPSSGV